MSSKSPRSRRTELLHLRVTPEVIARLDLLADKIGTSRATAGFKALDWHLPVAEERAA